MQLIDQYFIATETKRNELLKYAHFFIFMPGRLPIISVRNCTYLFRTHSPRIIDFVYEALYLFNNKRREFRFTVLY